MACFRPHLQISSPRISNSKILIDLMDNIINFGTNSSSFHKKYFWSWFRKKEEKPIECRTNVVKDSRCRKRVPECPSFICSSEPSKCLDEGYGKPIKPKKKSWFSKTPIVIKPKPSNCPPTPCPKELTIREYILGPDEPLPDPKTCRMAYKYKQMCNAEDPRLDDSRYQTTKGDVLIFSEPCKFETRSIVGPQPKPPPPYRPPNAVICKRVSDSVASLDCYCACVPKEDPICQSNLCPMHSKSFKLPYEEMRPRKPVKKFFTCQRGISAEDVAVPVRREACNCSTALAEKASFPPSRDTCALYETMEFQDETMNSWADDPLIRKLSRCERLKLLTMEKEAKVNLP